MKEANDDSMQQNWASKFVVVFDSGYYYLKFWNHTVIMLKEAELPELMEAIGKCVACKKEEPASDATK